MHLDDTPNHLLAALQSFISFLHYLNECGAHMYSLEKIEEDMKAEVKELKDTLSSEQDKLKTFQTKYDNTKKSLKSAKSRLAKDKE